MIRASTVTLEFARVGVPADTVVTNNGSTSWRWVRPDVPDVMLRDGLLYRLTACPTDTESDLPGIQRLAAFARDRDHRTILEVPMIYLVGALWLWVLVHVRAVRGKLPSPAAPISRTLGWVPAGLVLLALALTGCPGPVVIRETALPPPPEGCTAGATLCHEGAPWRCGPGGHWSQADRRCDRLGTDATAVVCCATPSALRPGALVHACVPSTVCAPAPEVTP